MKKFKEKKIKNISEISGGASGKPKTRRTHKVEGFFDGVVGNEEILLDKWVSM